MCKPDCIHNNNKNFYQKRCHRKTQVCKNDMFFLFFILIYLYLLHDTHTRTHTLFTIIFNWSKEYGKKFINNFRFFGNMLEEQSAYRKKRENETTANLSVCRDLKICKKNFFCLKTLGNLFFSCLLLR